MLRSRLIQTVLVVLAVSLPETGSRGATYPAAAAPTKSTNSHPGVDACHKQGRLGGCRGARVPVLRALRGGGSGFGTGAPLGPTKWQDNEKALEMYHNALRERPKDANLWCSFGHAITQLTGNYGRAGMAYRRAIELQANHSTALNNLGFILQNVDKDINGAEGCFRRALEAEPLSNDARVNLASLMVHSRSPPQWEAAATELEASLEKGGQEHLPTLVQYASLLVERPLPDYDRANPYRPSGVEGLIDAIPEAAPMVLGADPETGEMQFRALAGGDSKAGERYDEFEEEVAQEYYQAKNADLRFAQSLFKDALQLAPSSVEGLCSYANLKRILRDFSGAEELYRRALEASPDHAGVLGRYGLMVHLQGDTERAANFYRRSLKSDPTDVHTTLNLARVVENAAAGEWKDEKGEAWGTVAEAERLYGTALKLQPGSADILYNMGRLKQELRQDVDGALETYTTALEYDPRHVAALNSKGLLLNFKGKDDEAEACLQSAVRLAPEHAGVLCNYAGFLHTTRADMDGAQRLYKQALAIKPDHVQTLSCFGSFKMRVTEEFEEAREMLMAAEMLAPHIAEVVKRRATVDAKLKAEDNMNSNRWS